MTSSRKRTGRSCLALFLSLATLSCARPPGLHLRYGDRFSETDLATILAENPLGPNENIKVTTLGKGEGASHHIVQVRHRERPHIHKNHDLTIVMLSGEGYLMLDGKRVDLTVGDIAFIPRAVPHYFVNTFREPSAGLGIFSPPFDGKDTLPLPMP